VRTPLGRLGTTSDVADVVAFIASPDARWVTGQVVEASGGINPGASSVPAFVKQTFTAKMLGKALAAKSAAASARAPEHTKLSPEASPWP